MKIKLLHGQSYNLPGLASFSASSPIADVPEHVAARLLKIEDPRYDGEGNPVGSRKKFELVPEAPVAPAARVEAPVLRNTPAAPAAQEPPSEPALDDEMPGLDLLSVAPAPVAPAPKAPPPRNLARRTPTDA